MVPIIILRRVAVFEGQTVVNGDNNVVKWVTEEATNGLLRGWSCGEEQECAAMEVNNDGKGGGGDGGEWTNG